MLQATFSVIFKYDPFFNKKTNFQFFIMINKTTICFDFGNTRCKCAVFNQDIFLQEIILPSDDEHTIKTILDEYKPTHSILSSVIEHNPVIEKILTKRTVFHLLNHNTKLPITTPVGKPETIGSDRLALAVAAITLFPQQHNLTIGLGTCITYNFINKYHAFIGGSISLGMEMRFKALHTLTAKLPYVKVDENFPLIGYDTKTNILSGVWWGMAKEIDGIIQAYHHKYDNLNVLLSGGDGVLLAPHLESKIFADPHLIYKGLYAISEYNNR